MQPRFESRSSHCRSAAAAGSRRQIASLCAALAVVAVLCGGAGVARAQDLTERAAEIIKSRGCAACHVVPGVPQAIGTLGPSLKGLSTRARIAGGKLANTPENLRKWLTNPKRILPSTMMPNLGLTDQELTTLLQFFQTL